MSSATLVRIALLGGAALVAASGCGKKANAPRLFEVPANVRPIGAAPEGIFPRELTLSATAQYEQPHVSTNSARITEVSSAHSATKGWPIRQPEAVPVQEPVAQPATPPRRSEFVPIAMPASSTPRFGGPAPEMPAATDYSTVASQAASSPVEGPLWIKPDSPGWSGPSVPSPENAGREWRAAARPTDPAAPLGQPEMEHGRRRDSIAMAPAPEGGSSSAIDWRIPEVSRPIGSAPQAAAPQNAPRASQPSEHQAATAAMQVVSQRAMQMADQATAMANRGMLYSAQTELIQALALIAQALDVQTAASRHGVALNAGVTALAEAREFAPTTVRAGESVTVGSIAAGHRTPILRGPAGDGLSPVVAQQQYFGYAQNQLALAAGSVPAGSQILYRLGRLQTAMAAHDAEPQALREPQAIVFHQAALATDRTNWLAANELGVLYARYGQLAEARQLLIHSVSMHSNLEGWNNLSVVHRRLGEADLAQKANAEWQLLAKQTGKTRSDANEMVRWVDPQTFAAGNAADARWPASTAAKPAAAAAGNVRR